MQDNRTEVEKFLDTRQEIHPLDAAANTVHKTDDQATDDEKLEIKNRQDRRAVEKLRQEREANIALNERVKAQSEMIEALKTRGPETALDMPSEWIALYGDTAESKKAWQINSGLFAKMATDVENRTLEKFKQEQIKRDSEVKEHERLIGDQLERLEDQSGLDLTSNSPAAKKRRNDFLELVESLSPKDNEGRLLGYANFETSFEMYRKLNPSNDNSKQKELGARSMQKSGTSGADFLSEKEATRQLLRQQGMDI